MPEQKKQESIVKKISREIMRSMMVIQQSKSMSTSQFVFGAPEPVVYDDVEDSLNIAYVNRAVTPLVKVIREVILMLLSRRRIRLDMWKIRKITASRMKMTENFTVWKTVPVPGCFTSIQRHVRVTYWMALSFTNIRKSMVKTSSVPMI